MNLQEKINLIDEEVAEGLKLKSADRLRNLINEYPNELSIRERLAKLYYESGFLDAAGRYWVLTEPTDDRIKDATEIYLNSVNHSGTQILRDITFRGNKNELPEYARNKLNEFEADSKLKSNYIPVFKPKHQKERNKSKPRETFRDKLIRWSLLGILLLIVVLMIIGFVVIVKWIF